MNPIQWFAAGGGIAKCGPFKTQVAAWEAMRLSKAEKIKTGLDHPADTRVWPERAE